MEQGPYLQAYSLSADQEIAPLLWKLPLTLE
jgi:hypothetical protein